MIWPARAEHPWAQRLNSMRKYVFSSTLEQADWDNTVVIRGDVVDEARRLRKQEGRSFLIWGHTQLAEALMGAGLTDVLDLSIHPVIAGAGKLFFRDGQRVNLRLTATKAFSNIVKLTYDCEY
jgi:dihydrofolate reductase